MSKVTDINSFKRKRRRVGNTRWVLFVLFLFTCALGGYFFALSPFFNITEIQVSGDEAIDESRVISLTGLEIGQNIFAINLQTAGKMVLIDPKIGSCEIQRILPGKLDIRISERQAVAIIPTGNAFLYIDINGVVLARHREVSEIKLPLLVGIGDFEPGTVPGTRIVCERIDSVLKLVSVIPSGETDIVEEINVSDLQKILIYVDEGIKVSIGDSEYFDEKYQLTKKILEEVTNTGKKGAVKYIDVSIPEKPVIYYN